MACHFEMFKIYSKLTIVLAFNKKATRDLK